jgi:glycosyltransferase involved in cell wall biosynthesis
MNPSAPLVSVVIPAFNAGSVLTETLSSVREQTFRDFEVIINADEGSTDDTIAVARRFSETDPRFIVTVQPHSDISTARNKAVELARGEFIAFLDSDDIWLPEKLATQVALFDGEPRVDLTFTNYFLWDGQRDFNVRYRDHKWLPDGEILRELVCVNLFGTSTVMARRKALLDAGLFDPQINACEDWDMWLRMAEHGLRVRGTREPLARYRVWPGNVSGQKVKSCTGDTMVLEKNLQLTRHPELCPLYKRSLARARGNLELARARLMLDASPEDVPPAILRAWRICPGRLKWLLWYLLASWPKILGGHAAARIVHRKLIQKW